MKYEVFVTYIFVGLIYLIVFVFILCTRIYWACVFTCSCLFYTCMLLSLKHVLVNWSPACLQKQRRERVFDYQYEYNEYNACMNIMNDTSRKKEKIGLWLKASFAYTVRNFSQKILEMFWHLCPQRIIWALDKWQTMFFFICGNAMPESINIWEILINLK